MIEEAKARLARLNAGESLESVYGEASHRFEAINAFTINDIVQLSHTLSLKVKFHKDLLDEAIEQGDKEKQRDYGQAYAISTVCHLAFLTKFDDIARNKQ